MPDKLSTYRRKRDFAITPEPRGALAAPGERLRFVVQKHHARRLHYDFRLEIGGTLKSWAIPKGPSLDPGDKRLAVHVEDHPLGYIDFEGDIPEHQYGAGHVDVWDIGTWEPQGDPAAGDPAEMYEAGKLKFRLDGEKLHGGWTLVRTRLQASGDKEQWLLIKEKDEAARPSEEFDITGEMPDSVLSKPPAKKAGADGKRRAADRVPAEQVAREQTADHPRPARNSAHNIGGIKVRDVKITHPERVIDPESGLTKLDLARYYEWVAPGMLPFLMRRPVYLVRCPEGIAGEHFFQRHAGRIAIPGVSRLALPDDPGHAPAMAIESVEALVGAAQMGVVELHTCNATADSIGQPDCMVFDLDPDPGLPWAAVSEGARLTRAALDELGLKSFVKTSGGKGLHVVVPLVRRHDWDAVAGFSQALARHLARTRPKQFTATMGAKHRVGRIFIDYLRNQREASTVAAYSARARPGLPVSVPLAWEEVDDLGSTSKWNIATLPQRIAALKSDPWADYWNTQQTLTEAMKKTMDVVSGRRRKN